MSRAVTYTIGDDVIAQTDSADNVKYLLYDGHGSTRQLADSAATVASADNYSYDAYGQMLGTNATAANNANTNLLYAGEQYDSNASILYLQRQIAIP